MHNARAVKPLLVAQINFQEWTPEGDLRHTSFWDHGKDKARQALDNRAIFACSHQ
jgi:hypothetical protein